MPKIYQVVVHGPRGQTISVNLCDSEEQFKRITVGQLKEKIYKCFGFSPDLDTRLVSTDKVLDGDSTLLCDYGIQHMSVIYVVVKVPGGGGGGWPPEKEDGGMGDKDKSQSMEKLSGF